MRPTGVKNFGATFVGQKTTPKNLYNETHRAELEVSGYGPVTPQL